MASMMLCLDVFSSLSMSLSIASRLAMQTSHSLGSALALAASAVANSARHSSVRRSMVGGWRVTYLMQVSGRRLQRSAVAAFRSKPRSNMRRLPCTDGALALRSALIDKKHAELDNA